jgi:hypothetical protein
MEEASVCEGGEATGVVVAAMMGGLGYVRL